MKFNSRKSYIIGSWEEGRWNELERGEEIMEEVEVFKYLKVWFDRKLLGNVRLEKDE